MFASGAVAILRRPADGPPPAAANFRVPFFLRSKHFKLPRFARRVVVVRARARRFLGRGDETDRNVCWLHAANDGIWTRLLAAQDSANAFIPVATRLRLSH